MSALEHVECRGKCAECMWLRTLSRHEFMAWMGAKYGQSFCVLGRSREPLRGSAAL